MKLPIILFVFSLAVALDTAVTLRVARTGSVQEQVPLVR